MEFIQTWVDVLTKPKETFAAEKPKADFGAGAIHILIAGIIVGILAGIASMLNLGAFGFVTSFVSGLIGQFLGWIIGSGIFYLFARMFGGSGDFNTQLYLMAIYLAPLAIISGIFALIPYAGGILSLLASIYGLYLLTMALKETHNYSTGKAFLSWFIPVLILAVIIAVIFVAVIGTMSNFMSMMSGAAM